jgi:hypothetical protein
VRMCEMANLPFTWFQFVTSLTNQYFYTLTFYTLIRIYPVNVCYRYKSKSHKTAIKVNHWPIPGLQIFKNGLFFFWCRTRLFSVVVLDGNMADWLLVRRADEGRSFWWSRHRVIASSLAECCYTTKGDNLINAACQEQNVCKACVSVSERQRFGLQWILHLNSDGRKMLDACCYNMIDCPSLLWFTCMEITE